MKTIATLILALLVAGSAIAREDSPAAKQRKMDAECEQARKEAIIPIRDQVIAECIQKGKKSADQCRSYYASYDGPPNRPGFLYDLPACKAAYDYRKSSND